MYLTLENLKAIEDYLKRKSIKDTQLDEAITPLNGEEEVAFVQNGKNVKAHVKDIAEQLFLLGVSDFVNITDKYNQSYIDLKEAISLIPFLSRKKGQVITFINKEGDWVIYQFKGYNKLQWDNTSLWVNLFESIYINSILPDEEDLTKTDKDEQGNVRLKFKDKVYDPENFSGLGRVYLRKNIMEGKNILLQDMISEPNTVYHIQYDFDLNAQEVAIPDNCVIKFNGGTLKNGILVGNNTKIITDNNNILNSNITFKGSWNVNEVSIDWFFDDSSDDTKKVITAFELSSLISEATVLFTSGKTYIINKPITFKSSFCSKGNAILKAGDDFNGDMLIDFYGGKTRRTIKNITFDMGYRVSALSSSYEGSGSSMAYIEQCWFIKADTTGTHYPIDFSSSITIAGASTGAVYMKCVFDGCKTFVRVGNNQDDILFIGCRFNRPDGFYASSPFIVGGINVCFLGSYIVYSGVNSANSSLFNLTGKNVNIVNSFIEGIDNDATYTCHYLFYLASPHVCLTIDNLALNINNENFKAITRTIHSSDWRNSTRTINIKTVYNVKYKDLDIYLLSIYLNSTSSLNQYIKLNFEDCDRVNNILSVDSNSASNKYKIVQIKGYHRDNEYNRYYAPIEQIIPDVQENKTALTDLSSKSFNIQLPDTGTYLLYLECKLNGSNDYCIVGSFIVTYYNGSTYPNIGWSELHPNIYNKDNYFQLKNLSIQSISNDGIVTINWSSISSDSITAMTYNYKLTKLFIK